MKRYILALAVLLAPAAARAQLPAGPAFVMDARIGGGLAVAASPNSAGGGGASAQLAFGVRLIDRLEIELGVTCVHYNGPAQLQGGGGLNGSTTFTINPQLIVDILKSKDNKVAFYGKIGLPLGAVVTPVGNNVNNSVFAIGFDIGLGVRYSPHPNFAFGAEGGLDGFYVDPGGNGSNGITGVYGAVVGSFYWGKGT